MKRIGVLLVILGLMIGASSASALDLAKHGGVSGNLGLMLFTSGDDFGSDNGLRFIGQAAFKYNFSQRVAGVIESGWGWNSYSRPAVGETPANDDTLAVVVPTTIGLMYRFHYGETRLWPHVGAGVGIYSLGVKDSFRTWANGNNGTDRLTWSSPGFYLRGGGEFLFENGAAVHAEVLYHNIFSDEGDRFPDGWGNQNTSFAQLRVGATYYFSLGGSSAVPEDEDED
ncbi:MAG: hypothetical protein HKN21_09065 [Candidatus Eisenbacteria bacterium]|uniref:Outer membrane protein beta-barrel domain-containing protein n=1 Tax=Eiseniibacteriota bacterium TaxID=2212470 RepID=A0A7Y2EF35_UNCEI|nr:hypothetical protein [Candidatus Eisenbacteria bacterium]